MKLFFVSALLLCSLSTIASGNVSIVKVFDGTSATCKTSQDQYRYRLQAHKVLKVSSEVTDKNINLDITSTMLSCDQIEGKYVFTKKNIFEDFSYKVLSFANGTSFLKDIDVTTNSAQIVIFEDGTYNEVARIEAKNSGEVNTLLETSIDLNKVLTSEQLTQLNNGEEVTKRLDLFLVRNINIDSSDLNLEYNQSYGSFRMILKLKR